MSKRSRLLTVLLIWSLLAIFVGFAGQAIGAPWLLLGVPIGGFINVLLWVLPER